MKQNNSKFTKAAQGFLLICAVIFSGSTSAATITLGTSIFVQSTGPVTVQFVGGTSAGFANDLYLDSPVSIGPIFNNQTSTQGATVNLGNFTAGDELIFRNLVISTSTSFQTGPGSRNPDGQPHAQIGEGLTDLEMTQLEIANGVTIGTFIRGGTLVGF